ncbi:hypothetical protein BGX27_001613, partial [Mortierella sp. AM989]
AQTSKPTTASTSASNKPSSTSASREPTRTSASTAPAATTTAPAATSAPARPTKQSNTSATPLTPTPSSTLPAAGNSTACANSSVCAEDLVCVAASANATTGVCQNAPKICSSNPIQTCLTSADCPLAFSFCTMDNGQNICAGMGIPGTTSECKPASKESGLMTTVKYAGIAVGSVAALAILFALVRWQRRRQRSKSPREMFGEIDYGMTDRSAAPSKGVENYPFSSRPNAHGNDRAPSPHDYDQNLYYEEPVGYRNNMHNAKMQQDQYYGHDQYDNQAYGHDQHGRHGDNGFYDDAGYDKYQHQGGYGHAEPIASPAVARAMSPRQNFNQMDNYGREPSELDFGGHGHGSAHGGQGGYGRY